MVEIVRRTWYYRAKAFTDVGGNGGSTLGASFFPVGAPLRAIMFLLHEVLGVKTQFFMDVGRRRLVSCPP
jgi:hypothetical protein